MSYIFGPVPSRRLGRSLGIDMVPYKTCSFDCIYCELGKTTLHTDERKSFFNPDLVLQELKERLPHLQKETDYITLAGSGEPTLNRDLGKIISRIKKITSIPIAVLTNSSLLFDPEVRKALKEVNLIVPSLDAVTQSIFEKINLPVPGITTEKILEGLIKLREEFTEQIWLEILFCHNINDTDSEVLKLAEVVQKIHPDRVQINSVFRPPAVEGILPSPSKRLEEIKTILGPLAKVVGKPHLNKRQVDTSRSFRKRILELLKRRPCTINDIVNATGVNRIELTKILDDLYSSKQINIITHKGGTFYRS